MSEPRYAAVAWRRKADNYIQWELSNFPDSTVDLEWAVCKGNPRLTTSYIETAGHAEAWSLAMNLTVAHAAGQADIRMKIRDALGMARALN